MDACPGVRTLLPELSSQLGEVSRFDTQDLPNHVILQVVRRSSVERARAEALCPERCGRPGTLRLNQSNSRAEHGDLRK